MKKIEKTIKRIEVLTKKIEIDTEYNMLFKKSPISLVKLNHELETQMLKLKYLEKKNKLFTPKKEKLTMTVVELKDFITNESIPVEQRNIVLRQYLKKFVLSIEYIKSNGEQRFFDKVTLDSKYFDTSDFKTKENYAKQVTDKIGIYVINEESWKMIFLNKIIDIYIPL